MNTLQWTLILTTALGAAGMYLMLPRGTGRGRLLGGVLTAAALGWGAAHIPWLQDWLTHGVFLVLAGVTVVAAIATVTLRNPVYCAIWFGLSLVGTAGLFLLAGAQFLAVATIVVYAGAILVTFLFVLMLAQPQGQAPYDRTSWEALASTAAAMLLVGILTTTLTGVLAAPGDATLSAGLGPAPTAEQLDAGVLNEWHVAQVGAELFGRHLIAVEVAGTLLLIALVAAAAIVAQTRGSRPSPPQPPHNATS